MNKKLGLVLFIVVALVQLYIPFQMILDRENILETGVEFKFKTAPLDPNDPFRGKYITLRFDENLFSVANSKDWNYQEPVFVSLTTDSQGFAKIESISKVEPTNTESYTKAKASSVFNADTTKIRIDFPFNRYYMEESKAYEAEQTYNRTQRDTSKTTYALVSIKNGEAVLKDVLIDGKSIREIVKENQLNRTINKD